VIGKDLGDTSSFESRLRETDMVFSLVGEISHSRSMEDPERNLHLNTPPQLRCFVGVFHDLNQRDAL